MPGTLLLADIPTPPWRIPMVPIIEHQHARMRRYKVKTCRLPHWDRKADGSVSSYVQIHTFEPLQVAGASSTWDLYEDVYVGQVKWIERLRQVLSWEKYVLFVHHLDRKFVTLLRSDIMSRTIMLSLIWETSQQTCPIVADLIVTRCVWCWCVRHPRKI